MKLRNLIIPAAAATAAVVAATVYLIAPETPKMDAVEPFYGRSFAHRGLHTKDGTIPENSIPAFTAAAVAGYGVELDVHLTADYKVVVFHDDTLDRMCGVHGNIEDMFYSELAELRLGGTEHTIPLLTDVLDVLNGVPVILELKRGSRNIELCEHTLDIIDGYKGHVCIESFDPSIVAWFRKKAPDILRGQLSTRPENLKSVGSFGSFMLSNLLTNVISRPNFIAWGIGKKPLTVRACEAMGAMRVAWTSRQSGDAPGNDAVIFEHYRPAVYFK